MMDVTAQMLRIETRLESVESNMAKQTDISELETRLIKWFIGTAFAMTALAATISFGLARILQ